MAKDSATATGAQTVVSGRRVAHAINFSTGTGVGTAVLEMLIEGDWIPVIAPIANGAGDSDVTFVDAGQVVSWRWNVTAFTSGTIVLYVLASNLTRQSQGGW